MTTLDLDGGNFEIADALADPRSAASIATHASGPAECPSKLAKISIVLPVFNTEKYLRPLLASLLNQSESQIEIIAVDDGSTDASLSVLREIAQGDARLVVLAKTHDGPSAARNLGIAHSRGRWIAFADSDDWLRPQTLETWCLHAEASQLDLLIGNGFRFTSEPDEARTTPILNLQPWGEVMSGIDWIIRSVALKEWPHYTPLQLVSRKLLTDSRARFPEGLVHEDILWTLQLALAARRVGFVPDLLYGYRTNPTSITKDPSPARIAQRAISYTRVVPYLEAIADRYPRHSALSHALLRQAFREGASCVALLRRKLSDTKTRGELARIFFKASVHRTMFRGAGNFDEYWRSFRGYIILHKYLLLASLVSLLGRTGDFWNAIIEGIG